MGKRGGNVLNGGKWRGMGGELWENVVEMCGMVGNGVEWWGMVRNGGEWWEMVRNGGEWWGMVRNGVEL